MGNILLRLAWGVDVTDARYNAQIVRYPDGGGTLVVGDGLMFGPRPPRGEDRKREEYDGYGDFSAISAAAARKRLREICRCTSFEYFVTFTLDKSKIDRYDFSVIYPKLKNWLSDNVKRRGLAYVICPEHHKDGAIHFHGFINGALAGDMVDSGRVTDKGYKIYNLSRWKYGFSTCMRLYGEYQQAISYVCKYITKQEDGGKIGGRYYYSGGKLYDKGEPERRGVLTDPRPDLEKLGGRVVELKDISMRICYRDFADEEELRKLLTQLR